MLPALIFCIATVAVLGQVYFYNRAARRLYNCNWNDLFKQLESIPRVTVAQVGDEYLNPKANQLGLEPEDIWREIGGLDGIRRMRRNARILIALAAYAEHWNFTESVIVKERMRQDALHLRLATLQISARMVLRIGRVRIAFHLQESVGAYHLMTKRLLTLYQHSHSGLYPRLAQVIGEDPLHDALVHGTI
jgi:hypothetical protein